MVSAAYVPTSVTPEYAAKPLSITYQLPAAGLVKRKGTIRRFPSPHRSEPSPLREAISPRARSATPRRAGCRTTTPPTRSSRCARRSSTRKVAAAWLLTAGTSRRSRAPSGCPLTNRGDQSRASAPGAREWILSGATPAPFAFVESYYNARRLHSRNGYRIRTKPSLIGDRKRWRHTLGVHRIGASPTCQRLGWRNVWTSPRCGDIGRNISGSHQLPDDPSEPGGMLWLRWKKLAGS
jgi:hypothetical protein